ncbi:hypothetical protein D9619_009738 [Psilocybe cf. subviscida]|uniref:Beta-lactamase-related domain-containing protein n=1 Tax=Psilocybe cf. subviscida TaxID=2480587 RepID=A0A8H5BL49_9AGAR|nr:hypothetical protein D9619_009738 [Psilocybe cf. subviscida]
MYKRVGMQMHVSLLLSRILHEMASFTSVGKDALDAFIKSVTDEKKIPGIVLGVANVEREIYFQGGGYHRFNDSSSGEISPNSVFWICSQTKMIAALAALKLVDQGKLTFDTPVGNYLPEFRNPIIVDKISTQKTTFRPANTVVTLKHLLNFSSGLFYPVVRENLFGLGQGYTSKEMHNTADPAASFFKIVIGELPSLPLKFEPGTDFVYGWSSDALGFLVEKVSGQTLDNFCKQHFFEPLGMETSFYLTPELKKRMVDLTFRGGDGQYHQWANQVPIIEQDPHKVKVLLGGVGMYSSMRDYLKILQHLLRIKVGRRVDNPLLKKETVDQIFEPALTEKGSKSLSEFSMAPGIQWGTALAICTQDWPGRRRKGSAFWGGWAGTHGFIDPTTGIAVVFGIQMTPSRDVDLVKNWTRLEELVYSAVNPGAGKL